MRLTTRFIGALAACLAGVPVFCRAEITDVLYVQTGDLSERGELSFGVHASMIPQYHQGPAYLGEITANQGLRLSPELYYGITDTLQVAMSLPLVLRAYGAKQDIAGVKVTATWLHSIPGSASGQRGASGWYSGMTSAVFATKEKYDYGRTLLDTGLIGGYQGRVHQVAVNLYLTFSLASSVTRIPDYSVATKWAMKIGPGISVGPELYAVLARGRSDSGGGYSSLGTLYATTEFDAGKRTIHFGVGHGINRNSDPVTVKLSVFTPF